MQCTGAEASHGHQPRGSWLVSCTGAARGLGGVVLFGGGGEEWGGAQAASVTNANTCVES